MRVRVKLLRQLGRRAPQYGSLANGIVGSISMHTMTDKGASPYTIATLRSGAAPKDPDLAPPLYEPVLVTIGETGFLLRGFESIEGASYVQEWHCEIG